MARRKYDETKSDDFQTRTAAVYGGGYGACPSGKRGHATKKIAKVADKRASRLGRRYYRCPECNSWHSTTMSYKRQVELGLVPADQ